VQEELEQELERVRRSFKRELVLYEPPSTALTPAQAVERAVRVPIQRRQR
jgi:hypothetical protein